MTTCSRPGCTKKLRSNNTKGHCGSGCQSPEAPSYQRVGARGAAKAEKKPATTTGDAMGRFRVVAEALGHDPEEILEEFAAEWLNALKLKMSEG